MAKNPQTLPLKTNRHFHGLDGLRGLAALLVFLSHASASNLHLLGVDFKGIGKCGVALFFVLSANLLTLQFLKGKDKNHWSLANLKHYFLRRFTRIYPLYFVFLCTALVTTWASTAVFGMKVADGVPLTMDFQAWLQHLVLMRGDGITWSIAVEFKYYFLLPLVALLLHLLGRIGRWPQVLAMILLIASASTIWPPESLIGNEMHLMAYLGIFLTGSFCALLGGIWDDLPEFKHSILNVLHIAGLSFIIMTTPPLIKLTRIVSHDEYFPEQWMFAQGIAAIPVVLAAAYQDGILKRILCARFLRFTGMISFSLYLWHPVFIRGGARLFKGIEPHLLGWIALIGTLAASYMSYRLIERPFLKLGTQPRAAKPAREPERKEA